MIHSINYQCFCVRSPPFSSPSHESKYKLKWWFVCLHVWVWGWWALKWCRLFISDCTGPLRLFTGQSTRTSGIKKRKEETLVKAQPLWPFVLFFWCVDCDDFVLLALMLMADWRQLLSIKGPPFPGWGLVYWTFRIRSVLLCLIWFCLVKSYVVSVGW